LDPGFYNYGSLYLFAYKIAGDMVSAYGGGADSNSEKDAWFHIRRVTIAGRVLSCLAGSASVMLVFLLLRRWTNLLGALMGSAALAIAPGALVHARFATVDTLAAFLFLASVYCAVLLVPDRNRERLSSFCPVKLSFWAGVLAGLSAGTKYSGILALTALAVACIWLPRSTRWKSLGAGLAGTVLGFLVSTPGSVLNSTKFLEDLKFELSHTSSGHGLVFAATQSGFLYHIGNLFAGLGVIVTVLGAIGLIVAAVRRHPWAFVILAATVPTYWLLGRAEVKFFRYVLPLMPLLCLGFGWLVGQAHSHPDRKWRITTVLGMFGIGASLAQAIIFTSFMVSRDPRDQAADYLKSVAGNEDEVGLVSDPWFQTATLFPLSSVPRSVPFAQRDGFRRAATQPKLVQAIPDNPDERRDWDFALLEAAPKWIVYSSFESDDLLRLAGKQPVPGEFQRQIEDFDAFIAGLKKDYRLEKVFGAGGPTVHDLMYIRPTVYIWTRKTNSPSPSKTSSTHSSTNEGQAATP